MDIKEGLDKAAQAYTRMDRFRSDSEFRTTYDEKTVRFQAALIEGFEALYYQNAVLIELLKGRGPR